MARLLSVDGPPGDNGPLRSLLTRLLTIPPPLAGSGLNQYLAPILIGAATSLIATCLAVLSGQITHWLDDRRQAEKDTKAAATAATAAGSPATPSSAETAAALITDNNAAALREALQMLIAETRRNDDMQQRLRDAEARLAAGTPGTTGTPRPIAPSGWSDTSTDDD